MTILDDAARRAAADPGGMLATVESAADQWMDAVARARAVDLAHVPDVRSIANVVVCGVGGSGIAGDVAACIANITGRVPVGVVKGFALPAYVGEHTLVLLSSYSGETEETLACFRQAHDRGAPIVAVATGGSLADLAHSHDAPCVVPAAGLQPRAAFPYLAGGVLIVLERLGVLGDLTADLVELDEVLREQAAAYGADMPLERNAAKRLGTTLEGRVPIVWGQEGPLAVAAARWKTQLNENAKVPAFSSFAPELGHNEIVGFSEGVDALAHVVVVVLRSPVEHPRVAARVEAAGRLIGELVAVEEARVHGKTPLAQLASAVHLGDLTSVYLAILRGIDPTPIEAISRLKAELT